MQVAASPTNQSDTKPSISSVTIVVAAITISLAVLVFFGFVIPTLHDIKSSHQLMFINDIYDSSLASHQRSLGNLPGHLALQQDVDCFYPKRWYSTQSSQFTSSSVPYSLPHLNQTASCVPHAVDEHNELVVESQYSKVHEVNTQQEHASDPYTITSSFFLSIQELKHELSQVLSELHRQHYTPPPRQRPGAMRALTGIERPRSAVDFDPQLYPPTKPRPESNMIAIVSDAKQKSHSHQYFECIPNKYLCLWYHRAVSIYSTLTYQLLRTLLHLKTAFRSNGILSSNTDIGDIVKTTHRLTKEDITLLRSLVLQPTPILYHIRFIGTILYHTLLCCYEFFRFTFTTSQSLATTLDIVQTGYFTALMHMITLAKTTHVRALDDVEQPESNPFPISLRYDTVMDRLTTLHYKTTRLQSYITDDKSKSTSNEINHGSPNNNPDYDSDDSDDDDDVAIRLSTNLNPNPIHRKVLSVGLPTPNPSTSPQHQHQKPVRVHSAQQGQPVSKQSSSTSSLNTAQEKASHTMTLSGTLDSIMSSIRKIFSNTPDPVQPVKPNNAKTGSQSKPAHMPRQPDINTTTSSHDSSTDPLSRHPDEPIQVRFQDVPNEQENEDGFQPFEHHPHYQHMYASQQVAIGQLYPTFTRYSAEITRPPRSRVIRRPLSSSPTRSSSHEDDIVMAQWLDAWAAGLPSVFPARNGRHSVSRTSTTPSTQPFHRLQQQDYRYMAADPSNVSGVMETRCKRANSLFNELFSRTTRNELLAMGRNIVEELMTNSITQHTALLDGSILNGDGHRLTLHNVTALVQSLPSLIMLGKWELVSNIVLTLRDHVNPQEYPVNEIFEQLQIISPHGRDPSPVSSSSSSDGATLPPTQQSIILSSFAFDETVPLAKTAKDLLGGLVSAHMLLTSHLHTSTPSELATWLHNTTGTSTAQPNPSQVTTILQKQCSEQVSSFPTLQQSTSASVQPSLCWYPIPSMQYYDGTLFRLALDLGNRLLRAFHDKGDHQNLSIPQYCQQFGQFIVPSNDDIDNSNQGVSLHNLCYQSYQSTLNSHKNDNVGAGSTGSPSPHRFDLQRYLSTKSFATSTSQKSQETSSTQSSPHHHQASIHSVNHLSTRVHSLGIPYPFVLPAHSLHLIHGAADSHPDDSRSSAATNEWYIPISTAGSYLVEFATLSFLAQDPVYFDSADMTIVALFNRRTVHGLLGQRIHREYHTWGPTLPVKTDELGNRIVTAGVDGFINEHDIDLINETFLSHDVLSILSTLINAHIHLNNAKYHHMYTELYTGIVRRLRHHGWYTNTNRMSGSPSTQQFHGAQTAFPALQILIGDIPAALQSLDRMMSLTNVLYGHTPASFALTNLVSLNTLENDDVSQLDLDGPQNSTPIITESSSIGLLGSLHTAIRTLESTSFQYDVQKYLEAALISLFPFSSAATSTRHLPPLSITSPLEEYHLSTTASKSHGDDVNTNTTTTPAHNTHTPSSLPVDNSEQLLDGISSGHEQETSTPLTWDSYDTLFTQFMQANLNNTRIKSNTTSITHHQLPSPSTLLPIYMLFTPDHWLNNHYHLFSSTSVLSTQYESYPLPHSRILQQQFGDQNGDGLYLTTPRKITPVYTSMLSSSLPTPQQHRKAARTSPPKPILVNPTTCPNYQKLRGSHFYYTQLGYAWRSFPSLIDIPSRDEYGFE